MKFRLVLIALFLTCLFSGRLKAQDIELTGMEKLDQRTQALEDAIKTLQKLKVSGYIQTQYQQGEKDASLNVGTGNEKPGEDSFGRIGIRRGRIKFLYEDGIASGVFQLDITEKGLAVKDAYLNVKDPWFRISALKAGIFDRPFGHEISYSSSRRESPERSTVFRLMFPGERDLGGMLTLQAAKTSPLNFLKLEAGLFSGNGVNRETDSKPDFIGHLSVSNNIGNQAKYGLGLSYYNGSVYQGNENIYKMEGNSFVLDNDPSNTGQYAKREYIGFDGQFNITTEVLGTTKLHAEYLSGTQPSGKLLTESPNTSQLSFFTRDTYIRNFNGGYVMFVQDIGKLPFSAVLKYDWYDPNTKVSENEAGRNGTGIADLAQNTLGLGALWKIDNNLRLQAYYEINKYEKTDNIKVGETPVNNLKPNVFTLRLQYKF